MTIIQQLTQAKDFNGSEKELATYILKHKEAILNFSIQELATKTFTSTSTIVRLCRKIGLKGYKDFKIQLATQLQRHYEDISKVDPDLPFTEDDSNKEIAQKMLELMKNSLSATSNLLTNDLLEHSVRLITQANKLGIFAYGDTYVSALSFQNKLMKLNYNACLPNLSDESRFLAANFTKKDCAILISYSGKSKPTYQLAKILKINRCPIITLTSDNNSEIAKLSDLILPLANTESETIKISPFASQVAIEYVLNSLYSCLFVADYDQNQRHRIACEQLFADSRFQN